MHKIVSYLLVCVGILLILFAFNAMFKVFIAHQAAPVLVEFTELQVRTQAGPVALPMQAVNAVANLGLFALFMMFVVGVGGKLAGIGCQLLKNERIYEALLQLNTAQATQDAVSKKL